MVARTARKASKHPGIKGVNTDRPFWTLMVYADPGVGKTFLIGTGAREDHDTLIIRPPTDHTDTIKIHFPGVEVDEFVASNWQDADEIHEYLRHEKHGYRWVWLDSVSLFQEVGLDGIMEDLVANKPHRNLYIPDKGEYGENMSRLSRYIRMMTALDFNFGMTAHVFRYTFATTGEELMMPWIQGKQMPEKISAYANVVGYLGTVESEKHGTVRALYTETHDEYYAKDGFGAFKGRILNPALTSMEESVRKAKRNKEATKKGTTTKRTAAKKQTAKDDDDFTF